MLRTPLKSTLFVLLLLSSTLEAQEQFPLRFSIVPRGLTVRSGAPVDAEIEMFWNGTNLLEGRLEMTFFDHERVVGKYLSDEMAISDDGRKFSVMLPPMKNFDTQLPLDVIPRFITADGAIDLGEPGDFQIRVPPERKRAFVIANCDPPEPGVPGLGVLPFDALRVEQLIPEYSLGTATGTTVVTFKPQEMPAEGLAYFSYDLLVLAGQGFSELNGKQLAAIADWIEAGGSALVIPDRNLEPAHVEFLNRIARAVPGVSEFLPDKQGRLSQTTGDPLMSPRMSRPGLGRVVILNKPLDKGALEQPGLRKIVAFLWKVRALGTFGSIYDANWLQTPWLPNTQGGETSNLSSWRMPTGDPEYEGRPRKKPAAADPRSTEGLSLARDKDFWKSVRKNAVMSLKPEDFPTPVLRPDYVTRGTMFVPNELQLANMSYRPLPLENSRELRNVLTPSSIRAVPLSLVATVLALFLLVIGPGDYYFLGLLKARKFTWILFPLVALAFTAFMVYAAQRHMGNTDYRNALVFVDLGDTNKPVRTSRFELIFTATQKSIDTELNDALYARFDPPTHDDTDPAYSETMPRPEGAQPLVDYPLVESRMPTYCVVHDELPKWSPKLNRYTWLGSNLEVPQFDWESFDPKLSDAMERQARHAFAQAQAVQHLPDPRNDKMNMVQGEAAKDVSSKTDPAKELPPEPDVDEWKSLADEVTKSFPEASVFVLPGGSSQLIDLNNGSKSAKIVDLRQFRPGSAEAMLELIRKISAPPGENLLYCVSQISPTGAGNFEDLALLDGTDPHQWLLLIVTRDKDDWIVYRKLYRKDR